MSIIRRNNHVISKQQHVDNHVLVKLLELVVDNAVTKV